MRVTIGKVQSERLRCKINVVGMHVTMVFILVPRNAFTNLCASSHVTGCSRLAYLRFPGNHVTILLLPWQQEADDDGGDCLTFRESCLSVPSHLQKHLQIICSHRKPATKDSLVATKHRQSFQDFLFGDRRSIQTWSW